MAVRRRCAVRVRCRASRILLQRAKAFPGDGVDALSERFRELFDETPDKKRNILGPAQRRHPDRKDVQPIEQIFPNEPSAIRCPRSRCVAAMIRVSSEIDRGSPSRSIVRSSITRSSLTCTSAGRSPISSRKIVDPAASSSGDLFRPGRRCRRLFPRPNSSLSMSVAGRAAVHADQRPVTTGAQFVDLRREQLFPVPVSPINSTVAFVGATGGSARARRGRSSCVRPPSSVLALVRSRRRRTPWA